MYTVTIKRPATTIGRPATQNRTGSMPAGYLQYATMDDFVAAHNGTLQTGAMSWTICRCETRLGAWWKADRARLSGAKAEVSKGDRLRQGLLSQSGWFS